MGWYIFLLAYIIPVVRCFGSGQVSVACEDMRPSHRGASAQTNSAPYSIRIDRTNYTGGDEITGATVENSKHGTLHCNCVPCFEFSTMASGNDGYKVNLYDGEYVDTFKSGISDAETVQLLANSTPFVGFMLQAREVGGNSPVGSFTVTDGRARLLTCNSVHNSAVSHTSRSSKASLQATWRAPTSGDLKNVEFRASFVQDFNTFWVQVKSALLTYTSVGSPANSTSIPSITTSTSSSSTASSLNISSAGCGRNKVCFSRPLNCDPAVSSNCYFMSAMTSPSDAAVQFELTGPSQGYISIGFSDDQRMGNDDIYICGRDSNGFIQLQHAFSTGRRVPEILPLGNVSVVKASMRDGVISCSFTSQNPISTQRSAMFSWTYYLLFAYGPTSNGQIQFHTSGPFISDSRVDISRPQLVTNANRPHIIKAHGALMLIAWMTTGSLGMIIARYLKGVAKGKGCFGKDIWFLAHVSLMALTVAATIIAFILSFSHVKGWSGGAHPVLGCIVMILALIQPTTALFRCGPHHQWRFLFNWSHALNAVVIKGLAVAAIFTGLSLIDSTQNKALLKVMGGFVGWEAALYILLDFHKRWKQKDEENDSNSATVELLLLVLFFLGNMAFLVALLIQIGLS